MRSRLAVGGAGEGEVTSEEAEGDGSEVVEEGGGVVGEEGSVSGLVDVVGVGVGVFDCFRVDFVAE